MLMDVNEIREHLPHRYPFLLVDRVVSLELGKSIVAYKNVTVNEEFFNGHFPHKPVMPGVLMIEALAQTARPPAFAVLDLRLSDGNGLELKVKVSVHYHPFRESLGFLHQQIGPDYEQKLVVPSVEYCVRNAIGASTVNDIYSNRGDMLGRIQSAVDAKKIDGKAPVTVESLVAAGVLSKPLAGVRLIGKGELKTKLAFEVWHASKSAVAAVEKAGGSVKILRPAPAPAEAK